MRRAMQLRDALGSGGFSLHRQVGRLFKVGFVWQSVTIAACSAALMLIAGALDRTLILNGRDVGLLEHPGIWACIGLQVILPLSVRRSLAKPLSARGTLRSMAHDGQPGAPSVSLPLIRFLRLETPASRAVATVVYC